MGESFFKLIKPKHESGEQAEEQKFKQELSEFAKKIFSASKNGEGRFNYFLSKAKRFIDAGILNEQTFIPELKRCSEIKNKDEFIRELLIILEPILEVKKTNPILLEEVQRDIFVEQGNFTKLNEILSYGIYKDIAHIHFAPAKELKKEKGIKGTLSLVRDGLKKLAEIVKDNNNITKITATSYIVAEMPTTMESLGFHITGPVSRGFRSLHFKGDKRKVSQAEMSRERLLKYLDDNKTKEENND
ncbi:MAG: hypothetical protein WC662_04320 [Candidatus Paceibacterota bacterium]|jgi:hypothetical protein